MKEESMIVLLGGTVIPGSGADPIPHSVIVLNKGKIAEISALSEYRVPPEARVFDTVGKTILPGLIDVHTHIQDSGTGTEAQLLHEVLPYKALKAAGHARACLEAGFTTIRDLGAELWIDTGLRDAIQDGLVPGPRMLVSGYKITSTGTDFPVFPPEIGIRGRETMDSPYEVRKAVRTLLAMGVDWIKVMTSGRTFRKSSSPDALGLTLEETKVAVEEAHNQGKKVSAHAHGNRGIKVALEAGCNSIEHGTVLEDEDLDRMVRDRVFLVPTLSYGKRLEKMGDASGLPGYALEKALRSRRLRVKSFAQALSRGVKIASGSDAGMPFVAHGTNAFELAALVDAGMTPMQAIVAATGAATELLGTPEIGSIATGKIADLLVVEGDPVKDITLLQDRKKILGVFQNGVPVINRGLMEKPSPPASMRRGK